MTTPTGRPSPTRPQPRSTAGWTPAEIRGLGPVTDVPTAGAIFGLSRSVAYELARTRAFPVPLLRIGHRYRVPVAAILTALHLPAELPPAAPGDLPPAAESGVHPHPQPPDERS